jgi:hypothetical protein
MRFEAVRIGLGMTEESQSVQTGGCDLDTGDSLTIDLERKDFAWNSIVSTDVLF